MVTRKISTVLFDCDGTLFDSLGIGMMSFEIAFNSIGQAIPKTEDIKKYFGMSADKIFNKIIEDQDHADLAFQKYLEHQKILAKTTRLFNGIKELLQFLEQNNYRLGIVTGRHHADLQFLVSEHLRHIRFEVLIADSMLNNSKPHPEGLLLAIEKLGSEPSSTLYIGDSLGDMQAALRAGVTPFHASWDRHAVLSLPGITSVSRPDEVRKFITKINSSQIKCE